MPLSRWLQLHCLDILRKLAFHTGNSLISDIPLSRGHTVLGVGTGNKPVVLLPERTFLMGLQADLGFSILPRDCKGATLTHGPWKWLKTKCYSAFFCSLYKKDIYTTHHKQELGELWSSSVGFVLYSACLSLFGDITIYESDRFSPRQWQE